MSLAVASDCIRAALAGFLAPRVVSTSGSPDRILLYSENAPLLSHGVRNESMADLP